MTLHSIQIGSVVTIGGVMQFTVVDFTADGVWVTLAWRNQEGLVRETEWPRAEIVEVVS